MPHTSRFRTLTTPGHITAGLLVLAGLLLPQEATIGLLRGMPPAQLDQVLHEQLALGMQLFRACLVATGILLAVVVSLPVQARALPAAAAETQREPARLSILLLVILAVATALRLYRLDAGLWIDEIMTWANYANQPFGVLVSTYDSQNHHILFSLLAHASFLVFGESAAALRLPAVLAGVGSILALYLFAREFVSRREALLSAALLALSYHHVWFSQNARGYSALLLFALLSSWLLVRALRTRRLQPWLWYAVLTALGMYVHMTMLFMVTGQFLIFLLQRRPSVHRLRDSAREFLAGFCMAGLLTLVLYALVLPQLLGGTYLEGVQTTIEEWTNPFWTVLEFIRGLQIGFTGSLAAAVAGLVFLSGLYRFLREDPLVAQLLILPAAVTIGAILLLGHPLFPRTFFFLMGFGVMIAIRGTLELGRFGARLARLRPQDPELPGTLLCAGVIAVSALSVPVAWAPKQDYSGALDYAMAQAGAGDRVVTAGVAAIVYKRFHRVDWPVTETVEALAAAGRPGRRTWIVYTMPLHMAAAYPELWETLQQEYTVQRAFHGTLGDGTVFVAASPAPATAK